MKDLYTSEKQVVSAWKTRFFAVGFALCAWAHPVTAQSDYKRMAEVLAYDFEAAYPNDPAIVLEETGHLEFRYDRIIYRHRRLVMVLREEGKSFGQVKVVFDHNSKDYVNQFEVKTLRLNPEGKVGVFPVPKKYVKERSLANGKKEYSASAPFLQLGDVVEYTYELNTTNFSSLPPWRFQREVPVVSSTFSLLAPQEYVFTPFFTGDPSLVTVRQSEENFLTRNTLLTESDLNPGTWLYSRPQSLILNRQDFSAHNLPAIPREIFAANPEDYALSLRLQLKDKAFGANPNMRAFANWDEIHRFLSRSSQFFRIRIPGPELARTQAALGRFARGKMMTPEIIFNWVQSELTWNQEYGTLGKNLGKVLQERRGSAPDINMALFALLRDAGFKAEPVLIATRDKGRMEPVFPSLDQFNHVIVRLEQNGKEIFLDATEKDTPFGLLPKKDLNEIGFLVTKEEGSWIKVMPNNLRERRIITQVDLLPEGRLSGESTLEINPFTRLLEFGQDNVASIDQIKDRLFSGFSPDRLEIIAVRNADKPDQPLTMACSVETLTVTESSDNLLFFNPLIDFGLDKNPLPQGERLTPVDLNFPVREYYLIGVRLPPGYEIVSAPSPFRVEIADKAGLYAYDVLQQEGIIHISSVFVLNRTHFLPQEYAGVQQFFELMTEKQKESIILRKKAITP